MDVVNTICDDPTIASPPFTAFKHKRAAEADAEAVAEAEADALLISSQSYNPNGPHIPALPAHHLPAAVPALVGAFPRPAVATIQHPCHQVLIIILDILVNLFGLQVTTQHCFDSPKVKQVPVDVENCHTVTKVSCTEVG